MVNNNNQLHAGVFEVDITPGRGVQIAGDIGKHRPVETVEDPLFARAMVLESGGKRIALVSLDLCFACDPYVTEIRRRVTKETSIAPEALVIHATHSHGAPAIGGLVVEPGSPWVTPDIAWLAGDDGYNQVAIDKTVEAVVRANANLQPATIGWGSGIEGRISSNRRFVMRDGTSCCHPTVRDPRILHVEGPMDPEVGVVGVKSAAGEWLGMLMNFSCHPTHGFSFRYITAGWPGAWATQIKQQFGTQCVPVVLNGFAGNLHHANHLDDTHDADHRRMGRILAEDAANILNKLTFSDAVDVDYQSRRIPIPLRQMTPDRLEETKKYLAEHPTPLWQPTSDRNICWEWVYAVSRMGVYERTQKNPNLECEVQVLRIGSMAFVAFPGEPFCEGQLRIKLESPFYPTYGVGVCNAHVGYIPTPRAHKGGGYETQLGNWSKLAPEALDTLADTAIDMLKGMKTGSKP